MTTGADNHAALRWVLRAIKNEQDLTPTGENVKIDIDTLTRRAEDAPAMDTVRKCIRLLESKGAFIVVKKHAYDPSDPYDPPDATWELATEFELAIDQKRFNALNADKAENKMGATDSKSSDALDYKKEKARIGAIKYQEDHRLEQERWLEVKIILDTIHKQLIPTKGDGQVMMISFERVVHINFVESILDDLLNREICTCGRGIVGEAIVFQRAYYLQGHIKVRSIVRFERYRDEVTDLVKWIEQDDVKKSRPHATPISERAPDISLASRKKLKLLEILKEERELAPKAPGNAESGNSAAEKPGRVCKVHWDTFTKWIQQIPLDGYEQFENLLNLFMEEGLIEWQQREPYLTGFETVIEIKFPSDFEHRYENYQAQVLGEAKTIAPNNGEEKTFPNKLPKKDVTKSISPISNELESIYLVTNSLEPSSAIFLVLNEWFASPIRCEVKNQKGGVTYIKKLYDIAYLVNVPGKRVPYEKNLASDINNALFRIPRVANYMRTNKLKKPTLVKKSGEILVLTNEIIVKTELVTNAPAQYQSLYIDKTK